jgi:hypothetical protein
VDYLNSWPPKFDISFSMVMNENEFSGKSSLAAAGLWKAMVDTLAEKFSSDSGYSEEKIKEGVQKGVTILKDLLDKARKGTDIQRR